MPLLIVLAILAVALAVVAMFTVRLRDRPALEARPPAGQGPMRALIPRLRMPLVPAHAHGDSAAAIGVFPDVAPATPDRPGRDIDAGPQPATSEPESLRRLGLAGGGLLLAVVGQYLLDRRVPGFDGTILLLAGAALFALVTRGVHLSLPTPTAAPAPASRLDVVSLRILGFAVGAELVALYLFARGSNPNAAWLMHAASLLALLAGAWWLAGAPRPRRRPVLGWPVLAGALVLAVAAFFRLYRLNELPYGVWFDEAFMGLRIQRLLSDPDYRPVFDAGTAPDPSLRLYLTAPLVALLGPGALSLRLGSILAGLLGVLSVSLLARELFGWRPAWLAGLLLAVMAWHVDFSRIALIGIWSVGFDALAAALFLRALRTSGRSAALLGGAALGIGLNMYSTSRLLPAVLALYGVHRLAFERLRFWRRVAPTGFFFGLGTLLLVGPLALYAWQHPAEFRARSEQVSIVREIQSAGSLDPLWSSLRQHLLMFNVAGDRNGRHNLPGAPMLDPVTGALFVAGLAFTLLRWRHPSFFLPVAWMAVMLAGGVFSLSWEAPQGARTIDETVAVALLAALALDALLRLRTRSADVSRFAAPGAAALLLIGAITLNYDRYFVRQAGDTAAWLAFSTKETLIAERLRALPSDTTVLAAETFIGHPTIAYLGGARAQSVVRFDPVAHLPLPTRGPTALFLEDVHAPHVDLLRRLYPEAKVALFTPPNGGPVVLYEVRIERADLVPTAGLTLHATSTAGSKEERVATIDLEDSGRLEVPLPAEGRWEGALRAPAWGSYVLRLDAPAGSHLSLDGREVLAVDPSGQSSSAESTVQLARGVHRLTLDAPLRAGVPVRLRWRVPGSADLVPIPSDNLFATPLAGAGLLGAYYAGTGWSGAPAFVQIDPVIAFRFHVLPLNRPYSVAWAGTIDVPVSGTYRFGTQSIDASWLYVDGRLVVDNSRERDRYVEGTVDLAAGPHELLVRYQDQTSFSRLFVYWTPPNGQREPIPPHLLRPATEPPGAPVAGPGPISALRAVEQREVALVRRIGQPGAGPGELRQPRGVAVDAQGRVYVADTGNGRVQVFDGEGRYVGSIGRPGEGDGEFREPTDLKLDANGRLAVLDSEDGWIHWFDPTGRPVGRTGGPPAGFYHPRAVALDSSGQFFVADTGRSRIVVLDQAGSVVRQAGVRGAGDGQLTEPTGVDVDRDSSLYVVDPTNGALTRFGPDGAYQWHVIVPNYTTVRGPHLALGPDGWVYLTDPGQRRVLRVSPDGRTVQRLVPSESGREVALAEPVGIAVDSRGAVYVADPGLNQVLVLAASTAH